MSTVVCETALAELFDQSDWPELMQSRIDEQQIELRLCVPASLSYFLGHFPQQPILPGVVQIQWIGKIAARMLPGASFKAVKSVKYNGMIVPDTVIELSMKRVDQQVRFSIQRDQGTVTSGTLQFGDDK